MSLRISGTDALKYLTVRVENLPEDMLLMPFPVAARPKPSIFDLLKPDTAVSNTLMIIQVIILQWEGGLVVKRE
jgi:hypothetical protein